MRIALCLGHGRNSSYPDIDNNLKNYSLKYI